jgi:hypothetical protein
MIIHSYFTDGYFDWAVFYLQTLRHYNNLLYPVVFSTVGLTDTQIRTLKKTYPNITVNNVPLDIGQYAHRANVKKAAMARFKHECETKYVTPANKVWKLMVAGEDRPKALRDIMHQYLQHFYILHSDIDMYWRAPVVGLIREISEHDITLRIRPKINPIRARMSIGLMGYRTNIRTFAFMDEWIRQIEKVPPQMREVGYGQISYWNAAKSARHEMLHWNNLPSRWRKFGQTNSEDKIWSANLHMQAKVDVLAQFKHDFNNRVQAEKGDTI